MDPGPNPKGKPVYLKGWWNPNPFPGETLTHTLVCWANPKGKPVYLKGWWDPNPFPGGTLTQTLVCWAQHGPLCWAHMRSAVP